MKAQLFDTCSTLPLFQRLTDSMIYFFEQNFPQFLHSSCLNHHHVDHLTIFSRPTQAYAPLPP